MKRDKRDSREVGLEILHLALRHHPGSHHLHYGYWEAGLEPTIANLPKAQEAYCEFLISHIPEGTRSILDVGCGTGALARRLQDAGYEVECISPSRAFARYARELLDEGTPIHECYYEDFAPQRRYDLVLFSESFQYMKIEQALEKTMDAMDEESPISFTNAIRSSRGSSSGRFARSWKRPSGNTSAGRKPLRSLPSTRPIGCSFSPSLPLSGAACLRCDGLAGRRPERASPGFRIRGRHGCRGNDRLICLSEVPRV